MPVKIDRTGESRINNQGLKMTIVEYRNGHDIDVQFEDGKVVTNKYYGHFVMGKIRNPYYKSHLGETGVNNQGVKMTIVEWRNAIDIDIQFEDGQIKKTRYDHFRDGTVSHHKYHINSTQEKNKLYKVGEQVFNTQKQKMTIVAYRSYRDIDVQFEDGVIREHCDYSSFKRGQICHPDHKFKNKHIDKVKHRKLINHIGESSWNSNGLLMTIAAYRKYDDIDIQFEDGCIVTNKNYSNFKQGHIKYPNSTNARLFKRKKECIGETNINNQGLKMTIISYVDSSNITIRFEDGFVRNCSYANFKNGTVISKKSPKTISCHQAQSRLGEVHTTKQGHVVKIIKYIDATDVTVEFETGELREHIRYQSIVSGSVALPNQTIEHKKSIRVGANGVSHSGIPMEIIDYCGADDITVKFISGYVSKQNSFRNFMTGYIKHPFPYQIGNITMRSPAYIYNGEGNFYCFCNKCKKSDIFTIEEIKNHKC